MLNLARVTTIIYFMAETVVCLGDTRPKAVDRPITKSERIYRRVSSSLISIIEDPQSRDRVLSEFAACWNNAARLLNEANVRHREDANARSKISENKEKIAKSLREIDSLKSITRGEFEERTDFAARQNNAKLRIESLIRNNEELERENQHLQASLHNAAELPPPPQMNLKFTSDRIPISGALDLGGCYTLASRDNNDSLWLCGTNDCQMLTLGKFNIDEKNFPCSITSFKSVDILAPNSSFDFKECLPEDGNAVVKMSVELERCDAVLGPFETADEAKTFKEGVMAGKQHIELRFDASVTVRSEEKAIMLEPERRIYEDDTGERIAMGVLALGVYALTGEAPSVNCIPDRKLKNIVPAKYKRYKFYYIDWKLRIQGGPKCVVSAPPGHTNGGTSNVGRVKDVLIIPKEQLQQLLSTSSSSDGK